MHCSGGRRLQADDDAQELRLTAARSTHQCHDFVAADRKIKMLVQYGAGDFIAQAAYVDDQVRRFERAWNRRFM